MVNNRFQYKNITTICLTSQACLITDFSIKHYHNLSNKSGMVNNRNITTICLTSQAWLITDFSIKTLLNLFNKSGMVNNRFQYKTLLQSV